MVDDGPDHLLRLACRQCGMEVVVGLPEVALGKLDTVGT